VSGAEQWDFEVFTERGPRLDALLPEWERLAVEHGSSFVSRPAYGLSWFDHLGKGQLHVATLRRDGVLVALAPLHRRILLGQPVLRWLGHGLGTVGEVLSCDGQAAHELWTTLAERGTALQLTHVRPDATAILALRRHPAYRTHLQVTDRCPVLTLAPGVRAGQLRGKETLKRLAKYRGALQREGRPFSVEVVEDAAGLCRRWPEIVAVAAAADAGRDRQNLCGPPYDGFTRSVLEAEAVAGRLLVIGALVGDRWVAHRIGLRAGPTSEQWLTRFEPAMTKYSPGHLLMEWIVDNHEQLGVGRVDLLLGESSIKLLWTQQGYDVALLTAAPSGLGRVRTAATLVEFLGATARRVRR